MKHRRMWKAVAGTTVSVLALLTATVAMGETLVGKTIESRVLLGFKVADAGVQEMLPDGWVPVTLPKGPVGGANLIMALIDRHLIMDGEGASSEPASGPTVAFFAYAKSGDVEELRGFVTYVFEEPPLIDPYKTSVPADITRTTSLSDGDAGDRTQREDWAITPAHGGALSVSLDFKVMGYSWTEGGESRPYSPVMPDFYRIYRYDQLATLAMNTNAGRALDGSVEFTSTDPNLAGVFDGSEELVAIVSIPAYVREISLP